MSEMRLGTSLVLQGQTEEGLALLRRAASAEPPSYQLLDPRGLLNGFATRHRTKHAPTFAIRRFRCPFLALSTPSEAGSPSRRRHRPARARRSRSLSESEACHGKHRPAGRTRCCSTCRPGRCVGLVPRRWGRENRRRAFSRLPSPGADSRPLPFLRGIAREWYADMLTWRGIGDDHARAAHARCRSGGQLRTAGDSPDTPASGREARERTRSGRWQTANTVFAASRRGPARGLPHGRVKHRRVIMPEGLALARTRCALLRVQR